ncbi:MAG: hypothetical protein HFG45_09890 [Oscillospiraceae bacterium]|jgi:hypothetical protein|nr:hypothetical protein [Oscillospiraceae bacterium]
MAATRATVEMLILTLIKAAVAVAVPAPVSVVMAVMVVVVLPCMRQTMQGVVLPAKVLVPFLLVKKFVYMLTAAAVALVGCTLYTGEPERPAAVGIPLRASAAVAAAHPAPAVPTAAVALREVAVKVLFAERHLRSTCRMEV